MSSTRTCQLCDKQTMPRSAFCSMTHASIAAAMDRVKIPSKIIRAGFSPVSNTRSVGASFNENIPAELDSPDKRTVLFYPNAQVTVEDLAYAFELAQSGASQFLTNYLCDERLRLVAHTASFFDFFEEKFHRPPFNYRYTPSSIARDPSRSTDMIRDLVTNMQVFPWPFEDISTHPLTGLGWKPFDVFMQDLMLEFVHEAMHNPLLKGNNKRVPIFGDRHPTLLDIGGIRAMTASENRDIVRNYRHQRKFMGYRLMPPLQSFFVGYPRRFSYTYQKIMSDPTWTYATISTAKELSVYGVRGLVKMNQPDLGPTEQKEMPHVSQQMYASLCVGWCESLNEININLVQGASLVVANCMSLREVFTGGDIEKGQGLIYFAGVRRSLFESWQKNSLVSSRQDVQVGLRCSTLYLSNLYEQFTATIAGQKHVMIRGATEIEISGSSPRITTLVLHCMPNLQKLRVAFMPWDKHTIQHLHVEACPNIDLPFIIRLLSPAYVMVTTSPFDHANDEIVDKWIKSIAVLFQQLASKEANTLPGRTRNIEFVLPRAEDVNLMHKLLLETLPPKSTITLTADRLFVKTGREKHLQLVAVTQESMSPVGKATRNAPELTKLTGVPLSEIHTPPPQMSVKPLSLAVGTGLQNAMFTMSETEEWRFRRIFTKQQHADALLAHYQADLPEDPAHPAYEPVYLDKVSNTMAPASIIQIQQTPDALYQAPFLGGADDAFVAASVLVTTKPSRYGGGGDAEPGPSTPRPNVPLGPEFLTPTQADPSEHSTTIQRFTFAVQPVVPDMPEELGEPEMSPVTSLVLPSLPVTEVDPLLTEIPPSPFRKTKS